MSSENQPQVVSMFERLRPENPTVLIVEDEAIVAEDLSDQLSDMGYRVCGIADTCERAIALATQHRPHIVMMDIVIKGPLDGIATAEKITRQFHIPVIFATAYSDAATVARAAHVAPYGYITKPYQARDVRAAIEVALYKSSLEQRLKESERWFSATLRCIADGVIAANSQGVIQFVNPAAERLLDQSMSQLVGKNIADALVFADPSVHQHHENVAALLSHQSLNTLRDAEILFGLALRKHDDSVLHVDLSMAIIRDDQRQAMGHVIAIRDIQERLVAEQALKISEDRFRTAFEFAPIGMALVSMDGRFIQHNTALTDLLGYSAQQLAQASQQEVTHPDDWSQEQEQLRALLMGDVHCLQFEKRMRTYDGRTLWVYASLSLLRKDDMPVCYLYQLHDVSERKQLEEKMTSLAYVDVLTGLANRRRLMDDVERQMAIARRSNKNFALLFCDLDHFKKVNDTLGHEAGDYLLQVVAKRLTSLLRDTDTVARLGGDEFVILLSDVALPEYAARVANKIKHSIGQGIEIADNTVHVGGSVGISIFPQDGKDAKTLLRNADSALYAAKHAGRNGVQFYCADLTQKVQAQMVLMMELRQALERQEFVLYFQPIVNLQTRKVLALEALVRWQHPVHGLMDPDNFLPCVEQAGLMPELGRWIIRDACRARAAWKSFEQHSVAVSINVAPSQFMGPSLVPTLQAALQEYGVDPADVVIELTEQSMLKENEHHAKVFKALLDLGISIALDDFGMGYSSLSYVVRCAPSKIKIDRSFIAALGDGQTDDVMVESILSLCEKLPTSIIAEGIETQAQLDFLRERQCAFGQGYFFSKPLLEQDVQTFFGDI